MPPSYQQQTCDLIDGLRAVCASNGLGNDGNEYKIIVQTFLYKLLSDKFTYAMKRLEPRLAAPDTKLFLTPFLSESSAQAARRTVWDGKSSK